MEAGSEREGKDDTATISGSTELRGQGWADTSVLKVWPKDHQQHHRRESVVKAGS